MFVLKKNGDLLYIKLKHKIKLIKELQQLGVSSITNILRDIEIFEFFQSLPKDLCVYCKYEITADEFKISSDHVKTIIRKLKN